ncbi:MAG: hypothetical protein M3443_05250 [Actinomycetota bacterium]|nr:hypothetical protein [Actinomycetota bacterium]
MRLVQPAEQSADGRGVQGRRQHHRNRPDELSRATYDLHARMKWGTAQFNRLVQRWEAAYLIGGGSDLVDELRAVAESPGQPALHGLLAMALIEAGQVHDARIALRRFPHGHKDYLWLYTRCWTLLAASRLGEIELVTRLRAQLRPYRHLTCSVSDLAISGPVAYFTAEAALALGDQAAAMADLAIATDTARLMGAQPWLAEVREAICRCTGFSVEPSTGKRAELLSVSTAERDE